MTNWTLRPGKLPGTLLRELLDAGAPLPPEILLGPTPGEDAGAVRVEGGTLVATTDPITLTGRDVAAHAVLWYAPGVALCRALNADPWGVLASGTLLAAFPAALAVAAIEVLETAYPTAVIARAGHGSSVRIKGGRALPRYEHDEVARLLSR